jgi:hypothetical protein|nr:hypothetical protein [uncultured Psychroserpens sp.]
MKKLASILILVFAITFTTHAQKRKGKKGPKMTTEQQVTLKVKKMTLALDLTTQQQREISPLIAKQIEAKKAANEERREMKKADKKPSSDEIFAMKNKRLDAQIMMKNKMKKILNKEQFKKFAKMAKAKKQMASKKMKHQKGEKRKNRGDRDN